MADTNSQLFDFQRLYSFTETNKHMKNLKKLLRGQLRTINGGTVLIDCPTPYGGFTKCTGPYNNIIYCPAPENVCQSDSCLRGKGCWPKS
ncbi:hypothetical protein SAMN02787073_5074 [Chryseobacterium vrystaatense]|uniref:Uncharacterized protein n=2 Tax=Chryseobacterium vrystaatense TaxID=307480 RepID=A0A1M5NT01_9FLAO|nr:hypothetical protein SAMN02787073_5074 [Chryseobacterium vrystaatense]